MTIKKHENMKPVTGATSFLTDKFWFRDTVDCNRLKPLKLKLKPKQQNRETYGPEGRLSLNHQT